jgi:hypothetical protein
LNSKLAAVETKLKLAEERAAAVESRAAANVASSITGSTAAKNAIVAAEARAAEFESKFIHSTKASFVNCLL